VRRGEGDASPYRCKAGRVQRGWKTLQTLLAAGQSRAGAGSVAGRDNATALLVSAEIISPVLLPLCSERLVPERTIPERMLLPRGWYP